MRREIEEIPNKCTFQPSTRCDHQFLCYLCENYSYILDEAGLIEDNGEIRKKTEEEMEAVDE
jgi:hypothetical protein